MIENISKDLKIGEEDNIFFTNSCTIISYYDMMVQEYYTEHCSVWSYQTYRDNNYRNYGTDEARMKI